MFDSKASASSRCFLAIALAASATPAIAEDAKPPNIVLILADDLGYGDLSCYGHPKFRTPNLDRLASEGARWTQFNTPAPFCAPTRASLLTGRYPRRCGLPTNPSPDGNPVGNRIGLPLSEITLPRLLKGKGYATGMVGKWHLGHHKAAQRPLQRGFDEYLGILYSNDMRPVQLWEGERVIEYPVVQATLTRRYGERAVAFIEKNRDRPFFLYFASAMPHKPLACSEAFYKKSGAGLYGDVLAELDHTIGEILATLKELDLDKRTLVLFTSDNGPWFGGSAGGLRGMKGTSWEGGYRVPCIARWPERVPAGKVIDEPAVMMDLFATILSATSTVPPDDRAIDGVDLLPAMAGERSPREFILGQQGTDWATIRDRRWKLHVKAQPERRDRVNWVDPRAPDGVTILAPYEQATPADYPGRRDGDPTTALSLFDLASDPAEQKNVADQHPEEVARLREQFEKRTAESRKKPRDD